MRIFSVLDGFGWVLRGFWGDLRVWVFGVSGSWRLLAPGVEEVDLGTRGLGCSWWLQSETQTGPNNYRAAGVWGSVFVLRFRDYDSKAWDANNGDIALGTKSVLSL